MSQLKKRIIKKSRQNHVPTKRIIHGYWKHTKPQAVPCYHGNGALFWMERKHKTPFLCYGSCPESGYNHPLLWQNISRLPSVVPVCPFPQGLAWATLPQSYWFAKSLKNRYPHLLGLVLTILSLCQKHCPYWLCCGYWISVFLWVIVEAAATAQAEANCWKLWLWSIPTLSGCLYVVVWCLKTPIWTPLEYPLHLVFFSSQFFQN